MRRFLFVGVLFASAAVLCVPQSLHAQKVRGDRNRLSRDDVAEVASGGNTAYDVVRTLRPQWLSPPNGRNATATMMGDGGGAKEVVVYIDDKRQQSLDDLKTVKIAAIIELRYLDQNRAIQMRGPGHEMGVIEVITIERRK